MGRKKESKSKKKSRKIKYRSQKEEKGLGGKDDG